MSLRPIWALKQDPVSNKSGHIQTCSTPDQASIFDAVAMKGVLFAHFCSVIMVLLAVATAISKFHIVS